MDGEKMKIDHIIVQAGGKGTRLEHLTKNKPKALLPVENLPMIFHLFRKYPEKKFVVIGDYKKEVLRRYLKAFANVNYIMTEAEGTGTCAGISKALSMIPENEAFMLIWSDLILPESFELPKEDGNYIGVSQTFPCRWSYENGILAEKPSTENGVAGMFVFQNKAVISDVDNSGEFVRYLSGKQIDFGICGLAGTREFGLISEYEKLNEVKCRPFNKITEANGRLIKEAIDDQGKKLAEDEKNWYRYTKSAKVRALPEIYNMDPLEMEKINGRNVYEYTDLTEAERLSVLTKIINSLKELHDIGKQPCDMFSVWEAYASKTFKRLEKVRALVPFANEKYITINGRKCRNVFFCEDELERRLLDYKCKEFSFIHGDCTFSNILLRNDTEPVFIDPRGYFGKTKLFGDPAYDWAKLYYSVAGNYDQFNLKRFVLDIADDSISLAIKSSGWEGMEEDFFKLTDTNKEDIKLLHAIIWLSLTTYAWQDYDSVCGSFYNGIYYLEEVL